MVLVIQQNKWVTRSYSRHKLSVVMLDSFKQIALSPLNKLTESVIRNQTDHNLVVFCPDLKTHQHNPDIKGSIQLSKEYSVHSLAFPYAIY